MLLGLLVFLTSLILLMAVLIIRRAYFKKYEYYIFQLNKLSEKCRQVESESSKIQKQMRSQITELQTSLRHDKDRVQALMQQNERLANENEKLKRAEPKTNDEIIIEYYMSKRDEISLNANHDEWS